MATNVSDYIATMIAEGIFPSDTKASEVRAHARQDATISSNQLYANGVPGNAVISAADGGKDYLIARAQDGTLPSGVGQMRITANEDESPVVFIELYWKGDAIASDLNPTQLTRDMNNYLRNVYDGTAGATGGGDGNGNDDDDNGD